LGREVGHSRSATPWGRKRRALGLLGYRIKRKRGTKLRGKIVGELRGVNQAVVITKIPKRED